jgi:uncharacterized protein (DUF4213/DUF364 family)
MKILNSIIDKLPQGKILEVRLGLHWTVVVVETDGFMQAGLASTLVNQNTDHTLPDVPLAGKLTDLPALDVAHWALSEQRTLASIGVATINALMPRQPATWQDGNAEEMIAARGKGKKVALIGHFPFVERLRENVGELTVLELQPRPGDIHAEHAQEVLPQADVVAITGMSLINHTLPGLLALCPKDAYVMVLGPSSPLSPVMVDYGISLVSGSIVENIEAVLRTAAQGGNFRQIHKAGVRLVNILRSA